MICKSGRHDTEITGYYLSKHRDKTHRICKKCSSDRGKRFYAKSNHGRPRKESREAVDLTVTSWHWRDKAACAGEDIELFALHRNDLTAAKELCASCPVRSECLQDALALESWGYLRGGADPAEHSEKKTAEIILARARSQRQRDRLSRKMGV